MKKNNKTAVKKKLNILFVSEYFHPRAAGGEVWSWGLCTELAERGHKVTVLTGRYDATLKRDEIKQGVRVLRLSKTTPVITQRLRRFIAVKQLLSGIKRYIKAHHREIDVIHVTAYTMNVELSRLARKLEIPCVTSVHSYFGSSWKNRLLQLLEKRTVRRDTSAFLQTPSRYLQHTIKKQTGRDSFVVHNWLPDDFPDAHPLQKRTLLYVGSLEVIKNPLACIKAAKRLKSRLIVIGTGSLDAKMKEETVREKVNALFIDDATRDETLAYIGGASLVLVPSIIESFSLVALEAVAQGTPVSGTPVGILPELPGVTPFPPKKIPPRLSEATQKKVREEFSKKKAVDSFERLYRKAMSETR